MVWPIAIQTGITCFRFGTLLAISYAAGGAGAIRVKERSILAYFTLATIFARKTEGSAGKANSCVKVCTAFALSTSTIYSTFEARGMSCSALHALLLVPIVTLATRIAKGRSVIF